MASLSYFWYMQDVDAILFDFGGVIINIDYHATIDAFKNLGISNFDALYSQAQQEDLFDAIETGRISPQHFINGLLHLLPSGTTPNQVVHAWNAMLLDIPKERYDLLLSLKKKYRILMLSNTNSIHIDRALRRWDQSFEKTLFDVFDTVYFSHELGMRKPNQEIFEFVCTDQNLVPERILFIDDSEQHIHGAQAVGLQTHFLNSGTIQNLFS